jgi:hypothetical protein
MKTQSERQPVKKHEINSLCKGLLISILSANTVEDMTVSRNEHGAVAAV